MWGDILTRELSPLRVTITRLPSRVFQRSICLSRPRDEDRIIQNRNFEVIVRHSRFNLAGLRWMVASTTLFLSGVPALVYLVLWAILKERSTKDVVDVG